MDLRRISADRSCSIRQEATNDRLPVFLRVSLALLNRRDRDTRHRRTTAPEQTASAGRQQLPLRHGECRWHARQLLDHLHARNWRQGLFRASDEGVRIQHARTTSRCTGRTITCDSTGKHETQSIHTFSYGVADRGASIRVPHSFVNNGYKGYLEDRRPNSQGDPYQIASQISEDRRLGADIGQRCSCGLDVLYSHAPGF